MPVQDWFLNNESQYEAWEIAEDSESLTQSYRLYRFLTDLEDTLDRVQDDQQRLEIICPLVRRLLNSSEWIQLTDLQPDPDTGWAVSMLYDEPFFPLTVQLVAWSPGVTSPIHNHACWGLVALLNGQEKNSFWRRSPTSESPDRLQSTEGSLLLNPGDILCMMPNAIHQVEALGDEPTISFNLYGATNYTQRFEFDIQAHTAKIF